MKTIRVLMIAAFMFGCAISQTINLNSPVNEQSPLKPITQNIIPSPNIAGPQGSINSLRSDVLKISGHHHDENDCDDKQNQFKNSKILKGTEDSQKMAKFFDQKIVKAELCYRATENNFRASAFHSKCDDKANSLTIVRTDRQKIFGGFTPLPWTTSRIFSNDQSGKSFLFQFNHNDKFTLVRPQYTMYGNPEYGPIFGASPCDLEIGQGVSNDYTFADIGQSYMNTNYQYGNPNSHQRFSGELNFTMKQYEVWILTFAN